MKHAAVAMFLAFAGAYFLSALLRAVTATLAPEFSAELGLSAGDLGLLGGAYFAGFALTQLPLGRWLDRIGPRRVQLAFLSVAVLGCAAFALAPTFAGLLAARALIGVGVSACLMAPLTAYRHHFDAATQLRANSWMLMTGSIGMVASTLPVQWLLPLVGWRGLFWGLAGLLLLAMAAIAWCVPLAFVVYGGLIAVQSLWAGPWLTAVGGRTPAQAAQGLFAINLSMMCAFFAWGVAMPRLARRGISVNRLIALGLPLSLALLALGVVLGARAGAGLWALWCVSCTFVSLSQPALAQVFPPAQAGRALSAFNLVVFTGIFCVQWGIGLAADALAAAGWERAEALRAAFGLFGLCAAAAYGWFLLRRTA
jgi:Major Facilitator Superfamily